MSLRALHVPGEPLVVVNVWDAASARAVAAVDGCRAIATASAAIAAMHGVEDGEVLPRETMLASVKTVVDAVPHLPVTADLEAGYGDPVATAEAAWALGARGLNLEDAGGDAAEHAARLAAIRAALPDIAINARTDVADEAEQIERAKRYLDAGADCAFVLQATDPDRIGRVVHKVGGPVSVLHRPGMPTVAGLAGLGVARVSVGPYGHREAMAALRAAAERLLGGGAL